MAWLVLCRDVADSKTLRERYLQAHLAYIETVMDQVAVAGPLADEHGGAYSGSCFVYHTDDRSIAEALLRGDPYFRAGIYGDVAFHAFRAAAGTWVGGASWGLGKP